MAMANRLHIQLGESPEIEPFRGFSHLLEQLGKEIIEEVGEIGLIRLAYALRCGHIQIAPLHEIQEWMTCDKHNIRVRVRAIETREWKWKCTTPGCRTARFTGQSQEDALLGAKKHARQTGHGIANFDVAYIRVPEYVKRVHAIHGQKFRTVIEFKDRREINPDEIKYPTRKPREETEGIPF